MNIFLTTSPFQYICALEAKVHYKTRNNILLLVNQDMPNGLKQQKKLVDFSEWDHVIELTRTNRSVNVPKAIKRIKKLLGEHTLQHFFHAEYTGWRTKLLLKNLPIEKEVYFDDGTLTLIEYEKFVRNAESFHRPRFIQDMVVSLMGCKPIGKLEQSKNLELFTIFDIDSPAHPIQKNSFEYLKKQYNFSSLYLESAPLGFIGQGSIGHKNQKTLTTYHAELNRFFKNNKQPIIYFPHRTESEEVKEMVMRLPNLTYHQSELPLEIELIDKNIQLSTLMGHCSTVFFSCHILYSGITLKKLPTDLSSYKSEKAKTAYRIVDHYLQKIGVIEVKPY